MHNKEMTVRREQVTSPAAFEYVSLCLDISGGPLATAVRGLIGAGEIRAVIPPDASIHQLMLFREGGLTAATRAPVEGVSPVPNLDSQLIEGASTFLAAHPQGLFVVEDAASSSTDQWLRNPIDGAHIGICGDRVYHTGFATDSFDGLLTTLKRGRKSPEFVAYLVKSAPPGILEMRQRSRFPFALSDVDALAHHVDQVFVGAYDGEGYLVWRPTA